jgi:hypothetical protein
VDKLISQHFNNEDCLLPLREGFSDKFPEIVNIPITAVEVLSSTLSLKIRPLVDMMGCLIKLLIFIISQ